MDKFIFEKSVDSNVIKSVRFPEELNNIITTIVNEANKGKKTKEYSFNRFCSFSMQICT
ncbi:MAG: hypothetical protein HFJ25_02465 [Clostridia bacterium]|jgi:hypothetical protein|nr:hypothetical protein [Clostridia bacterium]